MKDLFLTLILLISGMTGLYAQDSLPVPAEKLKTWCYFLASDEMKGRKNGSPEMKIAANYIASVFKDAGLKPFSAATGYFQEYTTPGRNLDTLAERNVIGMIEGSDPVLKNEWIVLSAHFDHIGIRQPVNGDSIYNGADDNASGTVTLMALAKVFGGMEVKPKRSIIFAAFSGEEMGMRGSRWFVAHSPIALDQIKLDINFEMEGECATLGKNKYILTGDLFTDFDDLLDSYNKNTSWECANVYKTPPGVFQASDNAAFAVKREGDKVILNIPAFTLVTTDDMSVIHKVTDEPQRLDYDNMASLVGYLRGLVIFLAADPLNIHWDQEAFDQFYQKK